MQASTGLARTPAGDSYLRLPIHCVQLLLVLMVIYGLVIMPAITAG